MYAVHKLARFCQRPTARAASELMRALNPANTRIKNNTINGYADKFSSM